MGRRDDAIRWGRHLIRRRRRPWQPRTDPVRGRGRALREEADYWEDWLGAKGGRWADDYAMRLDPMAEVSDPALRSILALEGERVRILDVGAGPVTSVGYRWPGKVLSVVAVDPLARTYDRLLSKAATVPPVRTEPVEGTRLVECFGAERFDIAYSRNALDHAVDPVAIIDNMLAVVRPRGHVVLRHVRNEAVRQGYVQLHQWNFDVRNHDPVIWRPGSTHDLAAVIGDRGEIRCRVEPEPGEADFDWVVCVVRRQ